MNKRCVSYILIALTLLLSTFAQAGLPTRLPIEDDLCIGAWFLCPDALNGEMYRKYLDNFSEHSPYNLLTTSFRWTPEVIEPKVHDLIQQAVAYAHEKGLKISLDLDIRLARKAFQQRYPGELQEMLRFQSVPLEAGKSSTIDIKPRDLHDHMTGNTIGYVPLSGRIARVFSYIPCKQGIKAGTLIDITEKCSVLQEDEKGVAVSVPGSEGRVACLAAIFMHLSPAVFAPHLDSFQRTIIAKYADVPLDGLSKDEWGYPPCFPDEIAEYKDFWYSYWLAEHYAHQRGGRNFLRDCLLMHLGEEGKEQERQAAINLLHRIKYARNVEIEQQYYDLAKEFYGPHTIVTTHPTWVADPQATEYKKHGLDWWAAKRDFAQTDEDAPYPVRSALAKKWSARPTCYNQYYSTEYNDYVEKLWQGAATANRLNHHPLYPNPHRLLMLERHTALLANTLMRGETRLRLLSQVTQSPLRCPVAIIFGHACAGNWAGPGYNDPGLKFTHSLWSKGCYADLIPSTEIANGALHIDKQGRIAYGVQAYEAVVLYHPQFESPQTADFFSQAAHGTTKLFRIGEWSLDPDARPFDGTAALPKSMRQIENDPQGVKAVSEMLSAPLQTPAPDGIPALTAQHYRVDGTLVCTAGSIDNPAGAPIARHLSYGAHVLDVEAEGIFAIRLSDKGKLEALAAGGLKSLQGHGIKIELPRGIDLAFWHDAEGKPHGLIQDFEGDVPTALKALTQDWQHIRSPRPL